jgi:hypothetical protein
MGGVRCIRWMWSTIKQTCTIRSKDGCGPRSNKRVPLDLKTIHHPTVLIGVGINFFMRDIFQFLHSFIVLANMPVRYTGTDNLLPLLLKRLTEAGKKALTEVFWPIASMKGYI